jgi:uracil-DNA glycosylase
MMANWADIIGPLKKSDAFLNAFNYQKQRRAEGFNVYPKGKDIFNAFSYAPFEKLKVVIIGQDPYHEENQAMGLSFSVPVGVQIPPSLRNIYKELSLEIPGFTIPNHGNLIPWARQGVLLLNAVLTVEQGEANSHQGRGWEQFTDDVIKAINDKTDHVVFLLWGNPAQKKGACIDTSRHLVLKSAHPSPLSASRGFIGNNHFLLANKYLTENGKKTIDWQLPLILDGSEEL